MSRTFNELAKSSTELDIFICKLVMLIKIFKDILHVNSRLSSVIV